ncbi:MAG: hypothetical protein V1870_03540 [Candidatus Aenigmatarchaeota archaeon]
MDYWHNILTEKSWKILHEIKEEFNFILIGGWAVYLWARSNKSKDIDIIIDFKTLSELKESHDLRKNEKMRKYEIKKDEIDIDIYVKYYSKLAIPIEKIETEKIDGFSVAKIEYLLALKQGAELERKDSMKGEKDRIDILSMISKCSIDFDLYYKILKQNNLLHFLDRLIKIVSEFSDGKYIELNPRELKLKKKDILKMLKNLR